MGELIVFHQSWKLRCLTQDPDQNRQLTFLRCTWKQTKCTCSLLWQVVGLDYAQEQLDVAYQRQLDSNIKYTTKIK